MPSIGEKHIIPRLHNSKTKIEIEWITPADVPQECKQIRITISYNISTKTQAKYNPERNTAPFVVKYCAQTCTCSPNETASYAADKATIIALLCLAADWKQPLRHLDISSDFKAENTIYTNQCMYTNYHNLLAQSTRLRSPSVLYYLTYTGLNRRPTYNFKASPNISSTTTTRILNLTQVYSPKCKKRHYHRRNYHWRLTYHSPLHELNRVMP